jgi:hypothetical protein
MASASTAKYKAAAKYNSTPPRPAAMKYTPMKLHNVTKATPLPPRPAGKQVPVWSDALRGDTCPLLSLLLVVVIIVVILSLYFTGVFTKSSSSSGGGPGATGGPGGGGGTIGGTSSFTVGQVYQISPGASPSLCIQGPPASTVINAFTPPQVTLATCSSSEPSQYWLYTAQGALSLNWLNDGYTVWHLNSQGGCQTGDALIIAQEVPASPPTNSLWGFSNGQLVACSTTAALMVSGSLTTTTSGPSAGWVITEASSPPTGPVVTVGTGVGFESPAIVAGAAVNGVSGDNQNCNAYQWVNSGFAFTWGGTINAPCTNWNPSGSTSAEAGSQYAFIQAGTDDNSAGGGSPPADHKWHMTAIATGFTSGLTYKVTFYMALRSVDTTPNNNVLVTVTLGGTQMFSVGGSGGWSGFNAAWVLYQPSTTFTATAASHVLDFVVQDTNTEDAYDATFYFDQIYVLQE